MTTSSEEIAGISSVAADDAVHDHERDYAGLLEGTRRAFNAAERPLFQTDAEGLYELYLGNLPAERDIHQCSACRQFIETFGALVTVSAHGEATSAIWDAHAVPPFYADSVRAMRRAAVRGRLTGVFLSSELRWGTPKTGPWTHLALTPSRADIYKVSVLTAGQAMAAKREDFRTVAAALAVFTPDLLNQALRLLEADALSRSERFIGPVRWMLDIHGRRLDVRDQRVKDNILWRAIASAPEGYCHPRASVVGSLLEDIASGMAFPDVKARFDAKLHPLRYQRPQAAPAAGAIAAAEKMVQALGLAPAFERRFARLDEVKAIWSPAPAVEEKQAAGLFGHLKPKGAPETTRPLEIPQVMITWSKFERTVLPGAMRLQALAPRRGNYIGLTTAANTDAPPILKWDHEEQRNPVAWYVYQGGSSAEQWGLRPGWWPVSAVTRLPTMWGDLPSAHLGDGVILLLEGALDTRPVGNALFPETIRSELHGARSVIEAYARRATLQAPGGDPACGLDLRAGPGGLGCTVKVTNSTGETTYTIDRWD